MTLLSVVKDVCAMVGVAIPSSVFTNITGNRTMIEMVALANEMAQRIAYDYRDWQKLKKTQIYDGDGITTAFDLPENFKRMLLTSNVWRSTFPDAPLSFISDTDIWLNHRATNWIGSTFGGEWTRLGDQIHIFPAIGTGETAYFAYLDKNCVNLASGGVGEAFQSDGDSFALDERLFKLGMIWQWKANKGGAYAEDMGNYSDALSRIAGADNPATTIVGRKPPVFVNNVMFVPGSP